MSLDDWAREGSRTSRRTAGVESPIAIRSRSRRRAIGPSKLQNSQSANQDHAQVGRTARAATLSSESLVNVRIIMAAVHPALAFSDIGRPV